MVSILWKKKHFPTKKIISWTQNLFAKEKQHSRTLAKSSCLVEDIKKGNIAKFTFLGIAQLYQYTNARMHNLPPFLVLDRYTTKADKW